MSALPSALLRGLGHRSFAQGGDERGKGRLENIHMVVQRVNVTAETIVRGCIEGDEVLGLICRREPAINAICARRLSVSASRPPRRAPPD